MDPLAQRLLQRLMAPLRAARPRDSLLYSTNHLWIQKLGKGESYRIGIDRLLRLLMSHLHEIIFPVRGHQAPRGGPLGWLCQPTAGMVALPAPLPMTVIEVNGAVRETPSLALTDPYGEGWLVEVEMDRQAAASSLLANDAVMDNWQETIAAVDARLHQAMLELSARSVGETLPDGGRFITSISQLLSPDDYISLLQDLLKVAE